MEKKAANDILSAAESMAMMVEDGARAAKSGVKMRGVNRHLSRIPACLSAGLGVYGYGETPFMMDRLIMGGASHLLTSSLTDEPERQSRVSVTSYESWSSSQLDLTLTICNSV